MRSGLVKIVGAWNAPPRGEWPKEFDIEEWRHCKVGGVSYLTPKSKSVFTPLYEVQFLGRIKAAAKKRRVKVVDVMSERVSAAHVDGYFQKRVRDLLENEIEPKQREYEDKINDLLKKGTQMRSVRVWPKRGRKKTRNPRFNPVGRVVYVASDPQKNLDETKVIVLEKKPKENKVKVVRVKTRGDKVKRYGKPVVTIPKRLADRETYRELNRGLAHIRRVFEAYEEDLDSDFFLIMSNATKSRLKSFVNEYYSAIINDVIAGVMTRCAGKKVWPNGELPKTVEGMVKKEKGFLPLFWVNFDQSFKQAHHRERQFQRTVIDEDTGKKKTVKEFKPTPRSLHTVMQGDQFAEPMGGLDPDLDLEDAYEVLIAKTEQYIDSLGNEAPKAVKDILKNNANYLMHNLTEDTPTLVDNIMTGRKGAKKPSRNSMGYMIDRGNDIVNKFKQIAKYVADHVYLTPDNMVTGKTRKPETEAEFRYVKDRKHMHEFAFDPITGKGETKEGWDKILRRRHKHVISEDVVQSYGGVWNGNKWVHESDLQHQHLLPSSPRDRAVKKPSPQAPPDIPKMRGLRTKSTVTRVTNPDADRKINKAEEQRRKKIEERRKKLEDARKKERRKKKRGVD